MHKSSHALGPMKFIHSRSQHITMPLETRACLRDEQGLLWSPTRLPWPTQPVRRVWCLWASSSSSIRPAAFLSRYKTWMASPYPWAGTRPGWLALTPEQVQDLDG
jgi:hypothetical protein